MIPIIRKALATDLGPLMSLSRRTISASYRSFLGDEAVDAFLGCGAADRYVEENIARCWVILSNCGFGTALLRHVEAMLFQSYGELRLDSFEDNENANAFYRKNGWVEGSRYFDNDSGTRKIQFSKSV